MNPVTHFELPCKEARRASQFYESVFGWKFKHPGTKMDNYILATTAVDNVKPGAQSGAINGGLFAYKEDEPGQYPSVVISVRDRNRSMKLIDDSGGEVLVKANANIRIRASCGVL